MFANATDSLEKSAAAVAELNPIDGEVDVGAVAGGIIPDAADVIDKWPQTLLEGIVVFGLPSAFFKSFVEDEVVDAASLKDLINALKFVTMSQIVGAGAFGHFRDWTERQGVAF